MKPREYVYAGDPIPEIDGTEHADFLLHLQKSMLLSLVKKGLLTAAQMDQCAERLERRYDNKKTQRPG